MEPDHSANIRTFTEAYPEAVVVGNSQTFRLIDAFFGADACPNRLTMENGGTLCLGRHTLTFLFAPMVHWPEVMVTYDAADRVLFSADAFGKFGAMDADEDWACEARRYYIGIVGKYGAQVQMLLKKAAALELAAICPLHGPVLTENLGYYLNLYHIWSSYTPEDEGVCIAYTSVYGHTREAVELLAEKLREKGRTVVLHDLARCDRSEAVEDAFRYDRLVLATTTYNTEVFPFMRDFLLDLTERNFRNRTVGLIENGSWAPTAAGVMRRMLEKSKELTWLSTTVTLRSALSDESRAQIAAMAEEL